MKKFIVLLLVSLFSTCMYAYYPAFMNIHPEGVLSHAVMDIVHDDTNIYVAKLDGQLVIINKASGEKTIIEAKVGSLDYHPTSVALNGDKVWIGTTESKILYCSNGKFHQSGITLSYGNYQSMSPPEVENIIFDANGNMYVTCTPGFGFQIDTKNNVKSFTTRQRAFTADVCMAQDGTLWMGFYSEPIWKYGLARFNKDNEPTFFFIEHPELPYGLVWCLAMDNEGGIWYSTRGQLNRIQGNEVTQSYAFDRFCCGMAFDSQQRLWLADQHGPLTMMKDGVFTDYPCPFESKRWMCMDIDGDDIYIGTDEFLLLFRDGEYTKIGLGQPDPQGHQSTGINHTESSPSTFGIFDFQGRQLQDKPERGVYIQDGKKRVVR